MTTEKYSTSETPEIGDVVRRIRATHVGGVGDVSVVEEVQDSIVKVKDSRHPHAPHNLALLTATLLTLAACTPSAAPAEPTVVLPEAQVIATLPSDTRAIYKICDYGRAIYIVGWSGTGIAVVENAEECAS